MNASAALAHSITWASSKQSYLTAWLLADRALVDDCLRAYAYFRWADDMIDVLLRSHEERSAFIEKQKALVAQLYRNERPEGLSPEEEMLADLIAHARVNAGGLQSFIHNFLAVLEFDVLRSGHLVSKQELSAYSACLATAVMDGIQYFIGNGHPYPKTPDRTLAVIGAHRTHMLRDMLEDLSVGLVNIPAESLAACGMDALDIQSESFHAWVHEQVDLARHSLQEGRGYIDSLEVLRCKLAGIWYCARFECVLDSIEREHYQLRTEYPERRCLAMWLEMVRLGIAVSLKHVARRVRRMLPSPRPQVALDTTLNQPSYRLK